MLHLLWAVVGDHNIEVSQLYHKWVMEDGHWKSSFNNIFLSLRHGMLNIHVHIEIRIEVVLLQINI